MFLFDAHFTHCRPHLPADISSQQFADTEPTFCTNSKEVEQDGTFISTNNVFVFSAMARWPLMRMTANDSIRIWIN